MSGGGLMKIIGIIPARIGSTRLPGKPLRTILGKPMIQWVYEKAMSAASIDRVIVATDDSSIAAAVRGFGGEAVLTAADHPNGSSRIAEVAAGIDCDLVVNIQGDEPMLNADELDTAVQVLLDHPDAAAATLCVPVSEDAYTDPGVVKVVTRADGRALYFSRSLIPYARNPRLLPVYEHVGVYVYRKEFLLTYAKLAPSPLEVAESLEQLRILEYGYEVAVAVIHRDRPLVSVDTEADLARVTLLMNEELELDREKELGREREVKG
jgi:3-deoxy-manno-octulosonate cytidylyltransferase (CMP-KDO synthetase)